MKDNYYIVLDEAPIKHHSTPLYSLMQGNIKTAVGFQLAQAHTIKELVRRVPKSETVYRVYLHRTDGKTGLKIIR
jgi:hypothetical protein